MKALRPPTRREIARSTAEYQRVAALLESVQRETERRVPRVTFSEFANYWKRTCLVGRGISVNAIKGDTATLRNHLVPAFGKLALTAIRAWHVDRYQASKAVQAQPYGRGYDAHTIALHVSVLRRILRKAVEYGLIDANPVPPTTWSRFNPPPDASFRSWTVDEQRVAFAYLRRVWRDRHPSAYVALLTQLTVGLRSGELVALEKKDLDYTTPGLWVRRSKTQGMPLKIPKSRRERFHVIPRDLAAELRAWSRQDPSPLLFAGSDGKYLANTTLNDWYRQLCAEAGLRIVTSHGARHTTGNTYGLLGASDRMIADALGHVDVKSIERYTHHRRGAMAGLVEERWAVLTGGTAGAAEVDKVAERAVRVRIPSERVTRIPRVSPPLRRPDLATLDYLARLFAARLAVRHNEGGCVTCHDSEAHRLLTLVRDELSNPRRAKHDRAASGRAQYTCAFPGCERLIHSRQLCTSHYMQLLRVGKLKPITRGPNGQKPLTRRELNTLIRLRQRDPGVSPAHR